MKGFNIHQAKADIQQGTHANHANHANRSEKEPSFSMISTISRESPLDLRIRTMAERWEYAADELAEALSLAAADPVGWERLCTHDQAMWRPESEERDTQPLKTVRCADCRHYQRTNHPHLGHCTRGEIEAAVGLWESDRRLCESYRAGGSNGSA